MRALLLAMTLSLVPVGASADDPCPEGLVCRTGEDGVVRRYRRGQRHRQNEGFMIAGGAMLGGAWLLNIPLSGVTTLALTPDATARPDDYFAWSFVPLVGPMVQMFQLGTQHWDIPVLAIIEAVEVVGLIVAIVGTVGEDVAVLEPVASLRIMPWSTAEGAGVTVSGAF